MKIQVSILFLLVLPVCVLAGPQEDYVQQLSREANKTSHLSTDAQNWDQNTRQNFAELEKLLQAERPSFYKFYQKLSNANKEQVLEVHTSRQKLSITSKKIMDLYFNK